MAAQCHNYKQHMHEIDNNHHKELNEKRTRTTKASNTQREFTPQQC